MDCGGLRWFCGGLWWFAVVRRTDLGRLYIRMGKMGQISRQSNKKADQAVQMHILAGLHFSCSHKNITNILSVRGHLNIHTYIL